MTQQEHPGFEHLGAGFQELLLATLAAGPAGGCVHGHGAAAFVRLIEGTTQGLVVWRHGRAPTEFEPLLQVHDELQLGTVADVMAAGGNAVAEAVIDWLKIIHQRPDRGLGWTRCPEQFADGSPCLLETQREGGVCWQHALITPRELEFHRYLGAVALLEDRVVSNVRMAAFQGSDPT